MSDVDLINCPSSNASICLGFMPAALCGPQHSVDPVSGLRFFDIGEVYFFNLIAGVDESVVGSEDLASGVRAVRVGCLSSSHLAMWARQMSPSSTVG